MKLIKDFKNIIDDKYIVYPNGDIYDIDKNELKNQKVTSTGYKAVSLRTKHKSSYWVLVHQLVAIFYIAKPESEEELVIDHLDGDKTNNNMSNLEWVTRLENSIRANKNGQVNNSGENNAHVIITNEKAHEICRELERLQTMNSILEAVNLSPTVYHRQLVTRIKNKTAWTEISDNYTFLEFPIPTEPQFIIIRNIVKIHDLISKGLTSMQIVDTLFPGLEKKARKARGESIRGVIHNNTFGEYRDYIRRTFND